MKPASAPEENKATKVHFSFYSLKFPNFFYVHNLTKLFKVLEKIIKK